MTIRLRAAQPSRIPAKRFGYILAKARQRYKDDTLNIDAAGAKVKRLIHAHLISEGIDPKVPPLELTAENFMDELQKHTSVKAKASEMRHAVRKHIKISFEQDPAFYGRLSEKLEAIMRQFEENWEAQVEAMTPLIREAQAGRQESVEGIPRNAAPFYDLVARLAYPDAELTAGDVTALKAFTVQMMDLLRARIYIVNFWNNDHEIEQLQGELSDLLLYTGLPLLIEDTEKIIVEITHLAKTRHDSIIQQRQL